MAAPIARTDGAERPRLLVAPRRPRVRAPRPRGASPRRRASDIPDLHRILLVEDDPDLQVIATFALGRGGFELEICGDGRGIVEKARRFGPDLVLLDVMLPFIDGPSILKELRTQADLTRTPVIFMTARALPEEMAEYRQLGGLDVIVKPFDPMTLGEVVRDIWRRHHRQGADEDRAALADLKALYVRQLPRRLSEIEREVRALRTGVQREVVDRLFHLAHRLTGSSATMGFARVSEAARAMENALMDWRRTDGELPAHPSRVLAAHLIRLRRAAGPITTSVRQAAARLRSR
jgi:two-component system OmpR family response regulator